MMKRLVLFLVAIVAVMALSLVLVGCASAQAPQNTFRLEWSGTSGKYFEAQYSVGSRVQQFFTGSLMGSSTPIVVSIQAAEGEMVTIEGWAPFVSLTSYWINVSIYKNNVFCRGSSDSTSTGRNLYVTASCR